MADEHDPDVATASEARARFRAGTADLPAPDPRIRELLEPGECLVARRCGVTLDRRQPPAAGAPAGELYVTTNRLVLLGRTEVMIPLREVEDAAILGERIVLVLAGGRGVTLRADRPRLLRVQIAAARASGSGLRGGTGPGPEVAQVSPR